MLQLKSARRHISPLSQDVLNSVRTLASELRITMGSEPRKFMEVAEYKSFSGKKNRTGGKQKHVFFFPPT